MNNSQPNFRQKAIVLLLILGSAVMFAIIWQSRASHASSFTTTQRQYLNESFSLFSHTTTVTIQNYFPFHSDSYQPKILILKISEYGTPYFDEIPNIPSYLKNANVTVNSWEIKREYAGQEIAYPIKEINPTQFPDVYALGISDTAVTINWNYSGPDDVELLYSPPGAETPPIFSSSLEVLIIMIASLWRIIPYLFFVLAGFGFSWVAFKGDSDLRKAYGDLVDFKIKKETTRVDESLLVNLKILRFFPKQIGIIRRLIFGLSILLLQFRIQNCFKKYEENSDFLGKKNLRRSFAASSKQSLTSLSGILPELQLIVIILGFLTSVGISFSWNVGAIVPFLYCFGFFYFFLNIGSIFYLTGRSKKDRNWILGLLVLGMLIVFSSFILSIFRAFST